MIHQNIVITGYTLCINSTKDMIIQKIAKFPVIPPL